MNSAFAADRVVAAVNAAAWHSSNRAERYRRTLRTSSAGGRPRLTSAEKAVYDDLLTDELGCRVRLEQERIGFRWLDDALNRLPVP